MFLSFLHVVTLLSTILLPGCKYNLFIVLLIDEHVGCFQFVFIILGTFEHSLQLFSGHTFSFLLGSYLGVELLGQRKIYVHLYKKLPICILSSSVVSDSFVTPWTAAHKAVQARILEWVAIFSSRRSSWPRDWTSVSCIAGRFSITAPPGT